MCDMGLPCGKPECCFAPRDGSWNKSVPPVYGICDRSLQQSALHTKTDFCVNWRPGQVVEGEVQPLIAHPEKPRHAVGVSVLLIEHEDGIGRILLGKRGPDTGAAQGWLGTPGGRLEIAESFEECAQREFAEETGAGLIRANMKIIGYRKHFRFGEHYIMFYVLATTHVGLIENPEGERKCEGWDWYSAAAATTCSNVTEPKDILYEAFAEAERRKR